MSARWRVHIHCDGCGTTSDSYSADRSQYGATLDALRELLAGRGWTHHKGVSQRPHRDYCPDCTRARGSA